MSCWTWKSVAEAGATSQTHLQENVRQTRQTQMRCYTPELFAKTVLKGWSAFGASGRSMKLTQSLRIKPRVSTSSSLYALNDVLYGLQTRPRT